jgi:ketosteroid isomerase-like protein
MDGMAKLGSLLLFLLATGGTQDAGGSPYEFDADRWVSAWVEIWNTYDLDQVDELFLQDERLTYFSSEKEGVIIGIEAIREHHRGFGFVEGGKQQPNKLWLEDIHAETFGTTAVVTAVWHFKRPDGTVQRGPVTIVYVRQGEVYRIAHMNFSSYRDDPE